LIIFPLIAAFAVSSQRLIAGCVEVVRNAVGCGGANGSKDEIESVGRARWRPGAGAHWCSGEQREPDVPAGGRGGELDGFITVFCIVGPKAASNHDDPAGGGVNVVVPRIISFNHSGGGENIHVQIS
jgi:hypothetical protein